MPPLPKPATPRHAPFDPWNSSSTGHQRAETRPSAGWRESRRRKLDGQFGGAARRRGTWPGEQGREEVARRSVVDLLRQPGLMTRTGRADDGAENGGRGRGRGGGDGPKSPSGKPDVRAEEEDNPYKDP
ncbi:hypothetical protein E4U41_004936, partial [Claviceps citrina]